MAANRNFLHPLQSYHASGTATPSSINSEFKPRAIHFGAGNIGRGFIGPLLHSSGFHVVFADVNAELVNKINEEGQWDVHILGGPPPDGEGPTSDSSSEKEIFVDDVSAVFSHSDDIVFHIENELTEIITTAVGVGILPRIAPTIAKGLSARRQANVDTTLNVIACENSIGATEKLSKAVNEHLSEEDRAYVNKFVGWANCSVDRIVPPFSSTEHRGLDVGVEGFYEWIVEKTQLKPPRGSTEPPRVEGMTLTDNLLAYNERKLYTLNCGHAITAYLGRLKGLPDIASAINDKQIREIVQGALEEGGQVLCRRHGFTMEEHEKYIAKIIKRFENNAVHDDVTRVGRQPLRKLGWEDRLVGPARMCAEANIEIPNLSIGIASALRYEDDKDEQSVQLQKEIKEKGVDKIVEDLTGFKIGSRVNLGIVGSYRHLESWKKID